MHRTENADQLRDFAARYIAQVEPSETATVLALTGDLGAGKTNFAQGVARALGIEETIASPTFVIEKIYPIPAGRGQRFARLVHIDAYRIEDPKELATIGLAELTRDPGNLILIEWPEHAEGIIPSGAIRVTFDIDGDARIIHITPQ